MRAGFAPSSRTISSRVPWAADSAAPAVTTGNEQTMVSALTTTTSAARPSACQVRELGSTTQPLTDPATTPSMMCFCANR